MGETLDLSYFDQRTWLLAEAGIIVVDSWGVDAMGEILANAEFG